MIALLALVAAVSPADALAVAIAHAADNDDRFDVVAELDVEDTVALEAQRQTCGADGPSCAAALAGAFDARFVLFSRLYALGGENHLAFTLSDLKTGAVIGRDDVDGDEAALATAVDLVVPRLLREVESDDKARLFVGRVKDDGFVEESANVGLVVAGAALGVVGVVAGGVGGFFAVSAAGVLQDKDTAGSAKDAAQTEAALGSGAVVVGVVAVVAGVVLVVVGLPE